MTKRVFFKIFLTDCIKSLTKSPEPGIHVSQLKEDILQELNLAEAESSDDFFLLNVTTGEAASKAHEPFTFGDRDVIIMTKKTNLESTIFSSISKENIDSSFHELVERSLKIDSAKVLELDGESLDYQTLLNIGHRKYFIKLSDEAKKKICESRSVVEDIVKTGKDNTVYGINTGFGRFKNRVIEPEQCKELQINLIKSHACGVGPPLSLMQTRMVMALRINVLAKGCSGIKLSTLEKIIDALNADCLPYIPEKGSVGASGDLAPLSHMAIGLMGEGQMWSPKTGWGDSCQIMEFNGLSKLELEAKEGLAINNGTQVITAVGAEALYRADLIARQADVIAAFTTEVLEGVVGQFAEDVHKVRPHPGQCLTAQRLRQLMNASRNESKNSQSTASAIIRKRIDREELADEAGKNVTGKKVQDPYSIRCTPQVHGITHETISFVKSVLNTEINSATDNPLVMIARSELKEKIASAGNFHGEYPGMVLDQLAIAIQEIANISERRIERLVHPDYLRDIGGDGLPGFLVGQEPGLNNGFMILQYTAAALVSENKVLCHPSTVDSITTSGGSEDHVSMGTFSARKAVTVVENVENVLAIELLAACQALDLHRDKDPGVKTTPPLEQVHTLVRQYTKKVEQDHYMAPDIAAVVRLLQEGKVWEAVQSYLTDDCKKNLKLSYTLE